jgi:hypothetical protein
LLEAKGVAALGDLHFGFKFSADIAAEAAIMGLGSANLREK